MYNEQWDYSHYQRTVYLNENQWNLIDQQTHKDGVISIYWHKTVAVLHQQTQALQGRKKKYINEIHLTD